MHIEIGWLTENVKALRSRLRIRVSQQVELIVVLLLLLHVSPRQVPEQ